jgi:hypothetical protein
VLHLEFVGEGHGFRRAETLRAVARAELAFLGRALGFAPADADLPDLDVAGLAPLPPRTTLAQRLRAMLLYGAAELFAAWLLLRSPWARRAGAGAGPGGFIAARAQDPR